MKKMIKRVVVTLSVALIASSTAVAETFLVRGNIKLDESFLKTLDRDQQEYLLDAIERVSPKLEVPADLSDSEWEYFDMDELETRASAEGSWPETLDNDTSIK